MQYIACSRIEKVCVDLNPNAEPPCRDAVAGSNLKATLRDKPDDHDEHDGKEPCHLTHCPALPRVFSLYSLCESKRNMPTMTVKNPAAV